MKINPILRFAVGAVIYSIVFGIVNFSMHYQDKAAMEIVLYGIFQGVSLSVCMTFILKPVIKLIMTLMYGKEKVKEMEAKHKGNLYNW